MDLQDLKASFIAYHKTEVQDGLDTYGVPVHLAALYCTFCFTVYFLAVAILPYVVKGWSKFEDDVKKGWSNRMTAATHATIMSCVALT